jgi:hypothetical protein
MSRRSVGHVYLSANCSCEQAPERLTRPLPPSGDHRRIRLARFLVVGRPSIQPYWFR